MIPEWPRRIPSADFTRGRRKRRKVTTTMMISSQLVTLQDRRDLLGGPKNESKRSVVDSEAESGSSVLVHEARTICSKITQRIQKGYAL